ncbi:MAG: glycerol-3-phosphate transporter permease [Gammaproteobacteria bacterium RIFCSPHIGHO2_12_FULL_35_23]|nr:MAG: glycerol-3-phosphate transporter permease [Gammaproteobacteria bacterium RIFCSPHIGHO2_12_FULL_35_23]
MRKNVCFKSAYLPYLLVLPQIVITLLFFIWPALQAISESVVIQDPFGLYSRFVWFHNFVTLFTNTDYINSLIVTLIFSLAVTILSLVGGLFFAVLANRVTRGKRIYNALLILPYAVAPAIAGVLFRFLFDPAIGIFPYWLHYFHYTWNFTINSRQALFLIVIISAWQQVSYNFLFYLAGLQAIPRSLIESAALDGAGPFRRFWSIIFPLLSPTTFFLIVINMLYAFFDTFGIIQIVTQGGPANATQTLVYKIYQDGFMGLDFGGSAAQSVILMLVIIVLTIIQFKFFERSIEY